MRGARLKGERKLYLKINPRKQFVYSHKSKIQTIQTKKPKTNKQTNRILKMMKYALVALIVSLASISGTNAVLSPYVTCCKSTDMTVNMVCAKRME